MGHTAEDDLPTTAESVASSHDSNSNAPMNLALMKWISEQLPLRHPMLASQPEILLQLSSWYRRYSMESPEVAEVQNGLRNLAVQSYPSSWQRAAQFESSLWQMSSKTKPATGAVWPNEPLKLNRGQSSVSVYATNDRPHLDGLPDDACWSNALELELSQTSMPTTSGVVRLAFDEQWLFVWVCCLRDPQTKRAVPATQRQYDSDLTGEDRIKIVLDVDRDRMTAYQFEVDQRGLTRDNCWSLAPWNPRWYVAQHHTETHWMSELAIPLSELTLSPRLSGSHWCLGIERSSGNRPLGRWPEGPNPKLELIDLGTLHFTTAPAAPLPTSR
jgi:hypothetical protein